MADTYRQINAFARAALPPILSKYALVGLRLFAATPLGRMLGLVVLLAVGVALLLPAGLVFLLVMLADGNSQTAASAALAAGALAAGALVWGAYWLFGRWRRWRRGKLGY